jgi:alpha-galactosidase
MRRITLFFLLLAGVEGKAQQTILLDALDLNKTVQSTNRPQTVGRRSHLSIDGRSFLYGVHTQTETSIYLQLDGKTADFSAEVGVDDRSTFFRVDTVDKKRSFAEFSVIGDGKLLWQSGIMKYGDDSKPVRVSLKGIKNLLLKTTGGPGHTHVAWVDARFSYTGACPKTVWAPEDRALIRQDLDWVRQQQLKYPNPRINGAMKVGVRPQTPFYYPIAATGMRPMRFQASGLPAGLLLDKGIIRGKAARAGEYAVLLTATNAHGRAQRLLKIVVGDRLALTPPMGFQSWNVVEGLISETFIRELAQSFVDLGLRDVGYQYINMDDFWQGGRDRTGKVFPDLFRFPNGMKAVADGLHEKGLKFGVYSSPGATTCAGEEGSLNFEQSDVQTWASWGADYLKYDPCSVPYDHDRAKGLFSLMGDLLAHSGRSIVYLGKKEGGAQLWRVGGDLRDQWSIDNGHDVGILQSFANAQKMAELQEPGRWNDPDMLVIGIDGKGSSGNDKTDTKGCSDEEYRSQMSLWALMSAPLFVTADVRHIRPSALEILSNPEVIEVDQDPLGNFPKRLGPPGEQEIWVKEMEDGSKAIAFLNKSAVPQELRLDGVKIGLQGDQLVRDLWLRKEIGPFGDHYSAMVPSHGVTLIRVFSNKNLK